MAYLGSNISLNISSMLHPADTEYVDDLQGGEKMFNVVLIYVLTVAHDSFPSWTKPAEPFLFLLVTDKVLMLVLHYIWVVETITGS